MPITQTNSQFDLNDLLANRPEFKWVLKVIAHRVWNFSMGFAVFSYSSSFPIKMLATDAKKEENRTAVCKRDWQTWGHIYFSTCKNVGRFLNSPLCLLHLTKSQLVQWISWAISQFRLYVLVWVWMGFNSPLCLSSYCKLTESELVQFVSRANLQFSLNNSLENHSEYKWVLTNQYVYLAITTWKKSQLVQWIIRKNAQLSLYVSLTNQFEFELVQWIIWAGSVWMIH